MNIISASIHWAVVLSCRIVIAHHAAAIAAVIKAAIAATAHAGELISIVIV